MSLQRTKQTPWVQIAKFEPSDATTGLPATLAVGNRTNAYRLASLGDYTLDLRDFTNGIWLSVEVATGETAGVMEIWGYAVRGDAELIGTVTAITKGDQPGFTPSTYWADTMTQGTQNQTMDIITHDNGKAMIKFDSAGYKHIVCLVTSHTAQDSDLIVWARTW
jgi:hypothetical protein